MMYVHSTQELGSAQYTACHHASDLRNNLLEEKNSCAASETLFKHVYGWFTDKNYFCPTRRGSLLTVESFWERNF